ncbi:MAG: glutamate synthase large subunit [Desulfobacterota bacterium]|nr:glutamate synthase large subunit [Thermodesulfobacteriota bacterium]
MYQRTASGLYDPTHEHDSCGVGFVVNIDGRATHDIIIDAITMLKNLVHRGAIGGDLKSGDGAGMLIQIPHAFFNRVCTDLRIALPAQFEYGVGFFFLPRDAHLRSEIENAIRARSTQEGACILGWREVPVVPDRLGDMARASMPVMKQIFISVPGLSGDGLERKLYIIRKCIEREMLDRSIPIEEFFIASLSSRTIVYKGMFDALTFETFYPDLAAHDFVSALAVVHQRYSTNTFPSWPLAQPFRLIAHNGEINTLRGNVNKMCAREATLASPLFGNDIRKLFPIIMPGGSDSAMFDNTLELLTAGGRSLEHSLMMMIPEAFGPAYHISTDKRAFYEYHAAIMEPWDGPAAIACTDGIKVGAILDRNGLRPARYSITRSRKVVLASEVGVLDIDPADILEKGRLAPGKMLLVDTQKKRVLKDNEIKASVVRHKPYRHWLEQNKIELKGLLQVQGMAAPATDSTLLQHQRAFGYTFEEIEKVILPTVENAQEPVSSMGNDEALAILSGRPRLLYDYFKQLFAQVTNPPIDPYRENLVMSLMSFTGREHNLLDETPQHCRQLKLSHPILSNDDMVRLRSVTIPDFKITEVPILFKRDAQLASSLEKLCAQAEAAISTGAALIILSDRGIDHDHAALPALLAVSCVHHHLIKRGLRHCAGLVVETGEARDVMHIATLIGFGASAVNPYLAFDTIADLHRKGRLPSSLSLEAAYENYITAMKKGLLKIMSKMGISTIRSYRGAQLFEAIGLNRSVIDTYFCGTPSRIGGIGLEEIARETLLRHDRAFKSDTAIEAATLEPGGRIHLRKHAEQHLLTPEAIVLLQRAVRNGDYDLYRSYSDTINDYSRTLCTLRGLFTFKKQAPIPLDEVEPEESIIKRFVVSAMSFGSISKEAHETIAIAMNRLGAASNCGEGGEDEARYRLLPNGDSALSKVKQVASGRFGVTSNYLVHAEELQIKMAQGAKPGEGGQLPGHKVSDIIARVRHSTPGVMLISPPPHHDIYSIEDLAQLIFDLKNANPAARISVKLVSEVGVGTIAAGVAKAKADMVLISGHDGGTGASPLSSIKYAGSPWEIGLAETQQTLLLNRLRDKIRVQVDGQLKTGRDIVIAALLGAEEFGFGTMALVSLGCVMMRKCHLDACPVGIATQDTELRKRFRGKPEHLMNFMRFVARDVREHMAQLGFRTMDEMIGRSDILDINTAIDHWKTRGLDLTPLFALPPLPASAPRRCVMQQEHDFSKTLDIDIIAKAKPAIEKRLPMRLEYAIRNHHRTIGAMLSAEISKRYGSHGLPDKTIWCKCVGSAGQSFGAFLAPGITLELEGDANDYLGKGLSGGRIIVYPPKTASFRPEHNSIVGNVVLFGATSGEVFINGQAGERFCVRNSGALAVVEGVGDHGCEYMTGGRVIVLGNTGVNFAAGMSGGIAYVLDLHQLFDTRCNLEMVDIEPVDDPEEQRFLYTTIERHHRYTGSPYAALILKTWDEMMPYFVRVMPIDYRIALKRIAAETKIPEQAVVTEEVF